MPGSLEDLEVHCKAAPMNEMYEILEELLYTDDDLKIACKQLNSKQRRYWQQRLLQKRCSRKQNDGSCSIMCNSF